MRFNDIGTIFLGFVALLYITAAAIDLLSEPDSTVSSDSTVATSAFDADNTAYLRRGNENPQ